MQSNVERGTISRAWGVASPQVTSRTDHNVADAFRYRGWLVRLVFAQRAFVVAVDTTEARNPNDARRIAVNRSRAVKRLGNIVDCSVVADTESNRAMLQVDGTAYVNSDPMSRAEDDPPFINGTCGGCDSFGPLYSEFEEVTKRNTRRTTQLCFACTEKAQKKAPWYNS